MRFGDLDVDERFARSVDKEAFIGRLMSHSLRGVADKRQFLSDVYDRLNHVQTDRPAKKKVEKTD